MPEAAQPVGALARAAAAVSAAAARSAAAVLARPLAREEAETPMRARGQLAEVERPLLLLARALLLRRADRSRGIFGGLPSPPPSAARRSGLLPVG